MKCDPMSVLAQDNSPICSPRKRKAGAMPSNTSVPLRSRVKPLVPATSKELITMRHRVALVVDKAMHNGLAKTEEDEIGKDEEGGRNGPAADKKHQQQVLDPTVAAYLHALQSAIMTKVKSMCEVQDDREQPEAQLIREFIEFEEEMLAVAERLVATRAQVARLAAEMCRESLRFSEAADDRAIITLETNIEQLRKERDEGGTLLLLPDGPLDTADDVGAATGVFPGIDGDVLEPKISLLIGKLSELPGPLKSVLQDIPELLASLAKMVQVVEDTMIVRESRTEKLLGKAPPTPLPKGINAVIATGSRHPPEEVRAMARGIRLEQASKEWETAGAGLVGRMFIT